jgi:outer membrane beta-barrel protein
VKALITTLTLAALVAAPDFVRAQDEGQSEPAADAAAGTSPNEITPSDFPRVADEEETIYAVQRKAYLIKDKFEVSLMFSALFNDRFVQSYSPVASVTYHLAENFGLELFGGHFIPNPSGARQELLDRSSLRPEFARLTELLWAAGIGGQWSPIYGKIEIGGQQLGNFAFYVSAGLAFGQTRTECVGGFALDPNRGFETEQGQDIPFCPVATGEDQDETQYAPNEFKPMGSFAGGVRFYFNNWLGLRFEIRDYVFASRVFRPNTSRGGGGDTSQPGSQRFSDSIRNNVYANIGLSILFGGEDN